MKISIFWFRRDLRLEDNTALIHAINSGLPVLPIFIFDSQIIQELSNNDPRINFIYKNLKSIHQELEKLGSGLLCMKGNPEDIWEEIISKYTIEEVFYNKDYEPYALKRDEIINAILHKNQIAFHSYKDQVIFEENEILKDDGKPYTVFTPYKNKWLQKFNGELLQQDIRGEKTVFFQAKINFPSLTEFGFRASDIEVKEYNLSQLDEYHKFRDFPAESQTSYLGPHLRFGTVSIRQIISQLEKAHETFLNELIWREFFMQILFHFPHVVNDNFKSKYNGITWINDELDFEKWCKGETGYPLVDAGMRELNATGYMHNRVRMITAGFLCKHLLIDWRWGEAYFASKLLDYELSSNNGNWQWAAGTGCDAAPYFRIFNPSEQLKKFDKEFKYVRKWIPEFDDLSYPQPIIEHTFARQRALSVYKKGIE